MRTKSVKMYLAMYLAHVINTQKVLATLLLLLLLPPSYLVNLASHCIPAQTLHST